MWLFSKEWMMPNLCYLILLLVVGIPTQAVANRDVCGDPPPDQFREENNESIKGDLDSKANFLSRFVGEVELRGEIEATRKEIFAKYPDANKAYMDRYLAHIFCYLIFDPNNTQSPQDKIKAIQEFRRQQQSPFEEDKDASAKDFIIHGYNRNTPLKKLDEVFGAPISVAALTKNYKGSLARLHWYKTNAFAFWVIQNKEEERLASAIIDNGSWKIDCDVVVPHLYLWLEPSEHEEPSHCLSLREFTPSALTSEKLFWAADLNASIDSVDPGSLIAVTSPIFFYPHETFGQKDYDHRYVFLFDLHPYVDGEGFIDPAPEGCLRDPEDYRDAKIRRLVQCMILKDLAPVGVFVAYDLNEPLSYWVHEVASYDWRDF